MKLNILRKINHFFKGKTYWFTSKDGLAGNWSKEVLLLKKNFVIM